MLSNFIIYIDRGTIRCLRRYFYRIIFEGLPKGIDTFISISNKIIHGLFLQVRILIKAYECRRTSDIRISNYTPRTSYNLKLNHPKSR